MPNFRIISLAAARSQLRRPRRPRRSPRPRAATPIKVRGTCTQSSTAKLKLSREDSRIEVEFEVDQNRNGTPWKVTLRKNGAVVASATAVTRAPSGSFSLRRVISGTTGTVVAVATRSSGERCSAQAGI